MPYKSYDNIFSFVQKVLPWCFLLTVMNNVIIHEVLHETDSCCSIWSFLMAHKPAYKLLCYKTVGIRAQVVTSVLNQFAIVKSQP